MVKLTKSMKV